MTRSTRYVARSEAGSRRRGTPFALAPRGHRLAQRHLLGFDQCGEVWRVTPEQGGQADTDALPLEEREALARQALVQRKKAR